MARIGRRVGSFLIALFGLSKAAYAQAPALPDPDSLYNAYMNFGSLVRGGVVQPHWMEGGSRFWYAEDAPDSTVVWVVDPEVNTRDPLIDLGRLRGALTALLGYEPPGRGLPFATFEFMESERIIRFELEGEEFVIDLAGYRVTKSRTRVSHAIPQEIPARPGWPSSWEQASPDGRWLFGIRDGNVWLRSASNGSAVQLTDDATDDRKWVHNRWDGPVWSPDGEKLLVQRVDFQNVHKAAIPCYSEGWNDVRWYPYVTARSPLPETELYVIDARDGSKVSIDVGDRASHHLRPLGWQYDGSEIFFIRWNRPHTRVELLVADAATGAARPLIVEDRRTPSLLHSLWTTFFTLLHGGERFVWLSDASGTPRLQLHRVEDGGLIRVVTPDTLSAEFVVDVDESEGRLYWRGRTPDPRADAHLYRVGLDGKELVRLTDGAGYHNVQMAPSKRFFVDNRSSTALPPSAELRTAEGELVQVLSTADISDLLSLGWTPPESFVVKAADGVTDIFGGLYKPNDFDPQRKYPVIQTIYAATGSDDAPRGFSPGSLVYEQGRALSQLGFITVRMDWRGFRGWGTPEEPIYGHIGRYEIPDQVAALKQLAAQRPYMDLTRIGIFGASYGGYTALRAMLQAPEFYDVGIATMPVTDPAEHWGNEYSIGTYEDNPGAFEYASNVPLAGNLAGRLLLVHGTCDTAVPFALHTLRMAEALMRAGKPFDLLVLPGQGHGFTGESERYWLDTVRRYFVEHLRP